MASKRVRRAGIVLAVVVAIFLLLQVIPGYGRTNPAVVAEPAWDQPRTRALAKRACFDCHSNETVWPWYAYVAPAKWLVVDDVVKARHRLNFSDWHSGDMSGGVAASEIKEGEMPLPNYLRMHPEARLTETEKKQLADGLRASLK